MSAIDDPIEATRRQYPQSFDAFGIALSTVGEFNLPTKFISAIHGFFSQEETKQRIEALFKAYEWYLKRHEKSINDLQDKISSQEFIESVLTGINLAARTSNSKKIERFAQVIGYETIHGGPQSSIEDATAFIQMLSELGEPDIRVLELLYRNQKRLFREDGSLKSLQISGEVMSETWTAIEQSGTEMDEVFARCFRLGGYGLVINIQSNPSYQRNNAFIFRLTVLGNRLMNILSS